jgi:hypothetical protein
MQPESTACFLNLGLSNKDSTPLSMCVQAMHPCGYGTREQQLEHKPVLSHNVVNTSLQLEDPSHYA